LLQGVENKYQFPLNAASLFQGIEIASI